jgi:hypothetical protein
MFNLTVRLLWKLFDRNSHDGINSDLVMRYVLLVAEVDVEDAPAWE